MREPAGVKERLVIGLIIVVMILIGYAITELFK